MVGSKVMSLTRLFPTEKFLPKGERIRSGKHYDMKKRGITSRLRSGSASQRGLFSPKQTIARCPFQWMNSAMGKMKICGTHDHDG